jgi:hypothetical protein
MSNLTPFEIRLELLKMAKELLLEEYHSNKDRLTNEWHVKVESAKRTSNTGTSSLSNLSLRKRYHYQGNVLEWIRFKHYSRKITEQKICLMGPSVLRHTPNL